MSSANAAPEEEMVAMVAANNAAFFAVLFLETTFVDLFVVLFAEQTTVFAVAEMENIFFLFVF
jgi:hypothetical protein